jgi:two-component system response regulator FixJ
MREASRVVSPTVIIVDDDPAVLGSLKFAFEVEGFEVLAHGSAESLLEDHAPLDGGCLILDQKMAGMDGLTLLAHLRERGHNLPALLITTPSLALAKQAASAGVTIVEKPLLCDTLVSQVRRLLGAPAGRA